MRGRRHKLQVSTFPFLAVLLCAMGSLILVLLVMDRKAHRAAQARAQQQAAQLVEESARNELAHQAEIEQRKEEARKEWEQKRDALHEKLTREQIELQLQMRKVREELQGIAARLHYEQDTTTELRHKAQDERSRLQAEELLLRTLRSNAKQTENQSKESSQTLRRMTLDLLQIEQVLKDLKAAKQREQKTFSVVPYHGRRGESRRPLYVECTADDVIFHPDHKAMPIASLIAHSSDSASEVRAEVERRIVRQRQKMAGLPNNVDKTPYLLLLLRPSGVVTYHRLQRALQGLPLDFGYEFIDDDWVLDFPADDELPNTQPWMIATNTSSRPALPPPVGAAPPPRTNTRPIAGVPMGSSVGAFSSSVRGFQAGAPSGNGSWVSGDVSQSGSASGAGGGLGGTGTAMPGGGSVSGSPVPFGSGGNGSGPGTSASGTPFGSGGNGSGPGASASGAGGSLADARGSNLPSRGNGHGHPSAMPPAFPSDEGGMGYSGEGGAAGGGFPAMGGLFRVQGSNAGSRPASGFAMGGSPGGSGADLPGLGPPRALASGPGDGYQGGGGGTGQNWIAGTGSPGNGVAGNGWTGGGTGGSGVPGSSPGMGASADGRNVIARANNGGDGFGTGLGGGVAGAGGSAIPGAFGSGGSFSGTAINNGPNFGVQGSGGSSSGMPMNGSGGSGGPAIAGTSMPGASGGGGSSSGTAINNGPNFGVQGSGGSSSGMPMNGSGGSGGPAIAGTSMPGAPGGGGSSSGTAINNGPNFGVQGSGGSSSGMPMNGSGGSGGPAIAGTSMPGAPGGGGSFSGSGQAAYGGGSSTGTAGTAAPGASASDGSPSAAQINNGANPIPQGAGSSSEGTGGSSSGGATVIGGVPNGQAGAGGSMPANGGRSSDVVIFVDPITGQPTTAPRPASSPDGGSAESPSPQEGGGNGGPPRIRVVPVTSAASGGGDDSGDDQAAAKYRYSPPPSLSPRRLTAPRPAWVHGGRDWTIYVECRAGDLVLYPAQQSFTLAQATSDTPGNPLVKAIQQMIDRRQSSRRAGEPPYHPQVCLLVRPEHMRTYLTVYPALEALPVKKTRRNLDADDDVISIVTGAVP